MSELSTTAPPPALAAPAPLSGSQLTAWLDEAFAQLRTSSWRELLVLPQLDLLEALRAEVYFRALSYLRDGRRPHVSRSLLAEVPAQARAWAARLREGLIERRYRRYSTAAERGGVFFWPREPTHVKALLPVAAAVERAGQPARFVACQPKVLKQLRAAGRPVIFLPTLWPTELRQARTAGARLAVRLRRAPNVQLDPRHLPALPSGAGVSSAGLVDLIRWLVAKNLPAVFASALHTSRLIEQLGAEVIVVGSDVTIEGRTACQAAAALDTATACTMHGSITGSALHAYHVADRYLVYGDRDRRELIDLGIDPLRIGVCGAPYLDSRPRQTGRMHATIAARLGFDDAKPYVLIATSGPGNSVSHGHHRQQIEALAQASRELPGVQFVAKLHRKDRAEYYTAALATVSGARLQVVPYAAEGYPADIFDWLQGCELLLTSASTVALEAMLLDVPVVTMDMAAELRHVDFIDQGATTHVTSPQALLDTVARITASPEVAAAARARSAGYLEDVFLAVDGHSADRVAAEITALRRPRASRPSTA